MTSRERRAELTARSRKVIELIANHQYAVDGMLRRNGTYSPPRLVTRATPADPFSCQCPAFEREGDCRHVGAVEYRLNGGDMTKYPDLTPQKRPIYPWDNPRHKAVRRIQEILIVPLLRDILELLFPLPAKRKRGRQFTDPINIILSIIIRVMLHKAGDLAHSHVEEAWNLQQLRTNGSNYKQAPSVESITSNMTRPRTVRLIKRVIQSIALVIAHIPESAIMDGCEYNVPIRDRSATVSANATAEQKRIWQNTTVKIIYAIGDKTKMILGARVVPGKMHDSRRTVAILRDCLQIKKLLDLIADRAYLTQDILPWLEAEQIRAVIPPKSNVYGRKDELLRAYVQWWRKTPPDVKNYGRRQRIEAANGSDKRQNGENLKSKKLVSQAVELYAHVVLQQLRQLIWLYVDEQIEDIPFMSGDCRIRLERVRRRLSALPRPDLSPRHRDGLTAA